MTTPPRIGFIGLGSLGLPIAQNLLDRGHRLFVFNRSPEKAQGLLGKDRIDCNSVAALAREVDLVFTIVSDDAALRSITEGDEGLIANGKPGLLHVSMSTILPATAQDLCLAHQRQKQFYVACPVFGRPEAAKARKLNFVHSGPCPDLQRVNLLLADAGAAGVFDFGLKVEAANVVKLCGNFLIAAALEAMGESLALADGSGVDPKKMWEMFTQTLFPAPLYINYGNIVLEKRFRPAAFTAKLGLKDLRLVGQQAASVNRPMPLANLLQSHLQILVDQGNAEMDWSAVSQAVLKDSEVPH